MNNNPSDISHLLNDSHYWFRRTDGDFKVASNTSVVIVTRELLTQYHPYFPTAIDHQINRNERNLSGHMVNAMLAFYATGPVVFTALNGQLSHLVNVESIKIDEDNVDCVYVCGMQLSFQTMRDKGETINLPYVLGFYNVNVKKSELELCYPDWENRWSIAQQLCVGGQGLATLIFNFTTPKVDSSVEELKTISFE